MRMDNRRLGHFALVVGCSVVVLTLAGCGSKATGVKAYQDSALAVLQGDGVNTPNFTHSVGITLKAMYCAQYACTLPSEMEYLRQVAEQEVEYLVLFHERICKALQPPEALLQESTVLCQGLERMTVQVQELEKNAELARNFLARSNKSDLDQIKGTLSGLNQRIFDNRDQIKAAFAQLQDIQWLKQAFENADEEIP